jgi:hypothetical protein
MLDRLRAPQALAAGLLAMGALLAGCLDDGPQEITARSALRQAERAAEDWSDDATLVGIAGIELGEAARGEAERDLAELEEAAGMARESGEDEEADLMDDLLRMLRIILAAEGRVGDGRAAAWMFTFIGPEGGYVIAVGSDGVLWSSDDQAHGDITFSGEGFLGETAVGDWPLDSDDAAEAALELDTFRTAIQDPDTSVFTLLGRDEEDEDAFWLLIAGADGESEDEPETAIVAVNAVNGTVTDVSDVLEDLLRFREQGSEGGTLLPIEASASASFTLDRDHGLLAVHLEVTPPSPAGVQMVVRAPDGTETSVEASFAASVASEAVILVEPAAAGTYVVELATDLALRHQWTVDWCTDGISFALPFSQASCDAIDQAPGTAETLSPKLGWASPW